VFSLGLLAIGCCARPPRLRRLGVAPFPPRVNRWPFYAGMESCVLLSLPCTAVKIGDGRCIQRLFLSFMTPFFGVSWELIPPLSPTPRRPHLTPLSFATIWNFGQIPSRSERSCLNIFLCYSIIYTPKIFLKAHPPVSPWFCWRDIRGLL